MAISFFLYMNMLYFVGKYFLARYAKCLSLYIIKIGMFCRYYRDIKYTEANKCQ